MRYTQNTAAYWRSQGRTIFDEWIINPDDPFTGDDVPNSDQEHFIPQNTKTKYRWNQEPFTSNGYRRWKINFAFHWEDEGDRLDWKHDEEQRQKIRDSLKFMEDQSCLTFVEQDRSFPDYPGGVMRFIRAGGCWATVGRDPYQDDDKPKNYISLGPNCMGPGTIQHEVLHSLGVNHEQGRVDRDDYVNLHMENVDEYLHSQFEKTELKYWVDMKVPYDFHSVMQYSGTSFSNKKDKFGNKEPTITYKFDGNNYKKGDPVASKGGMGPFGLSSMDLYQLCYMYECGTCAYRDIPTYEDKAHEVYMYKCKQPRLVV